MGDAINAITSHPALLAVLAILGVLALFFLLKRLFKLALILLLVLIIGLGFYYGFKTPGDYRDKLKGAYEKTKTRSEEVLNKGKSKVTDEVKKLTGGLDKGNR